MPRRRKAPKRKQEKDPRYNSGVVTKFISRMMLCGKKAVGAKILYDALDIIKEKTKKDPFKLFIKALDNVKPVVEVKSRRVGGSTYQVPVEIREDRKDALAMRWIIHFARSRSGKSMSDKLSAELMDAASGAGASFKKKEDTHKMAEANKAFAHYRW